MAFDRFMIAPISTGLESDLTPWLTPQDSFTQMKNAYIYQGRVVKRFGTSFMVTDPLKSRLAVLLGTTDGVGDLSGTVPGSAGSFGIGQQFSIGSIIYTVNATGAPATLLKTGATTTATYNTTTGAYVFVGAPINTDVYYYPAQPVMGISIYESGSINNQPTYAWDQQFVYKFVAGNRWVRETTGTPLWHGGVNDFFWTTTWHSIAQTKVMFATNFSLVKSGAVSASDDPVWSFDGTTWAVFRPVFLTAGNRVNGARLVMEFKGRLLLLNTVESDAATTTNAPFINRCRFSARANPLGAAAWYEPGQTGALGGGFTDADTEEAIISAEFIKDRLIVYFEQSTWELVYTNNNAQPFLWQKINTELGSTSTFSTVPFDKAVLTIGSTGVHSCNGSNVERIDQKIPLEVLQFNQKPEAVTHVQGIRDYEKELVYWTYTSNNRVSAPYFANNILVYNYRLNTWSIIRDSFTCFGYFDQSTDMTWADADFSWEEADFTWSSYESQSNSRRILAGTPNGYVVRVMPDVANNELCMQITNITSVGGRTRLTIVNHVLDSVDDYIYINNCSGVTTFNDAIYKVTAIINDNTIEIGPIPFVGTYTGGGRAALVSNIRFRTKLLNPYVNTGRNVYVSRIDFCVQKTDHGQVTIDGYPSSSLAPVQALSPTVTLGTGVLETSPYASIPFEQLQTRLWHPVYFQFEGEFIQIQVYMTSSQMTDKDIAFADFELEGLIIHARPTSYRLQ